ASAAPPSSPVVQTASGAVQGLLDGPTKEWRGISYAAPPLGSLRWRKPAPVAPWTGVRQATAFHEQCLQLSTNDGEIFFPDGSEDCLYLNVFAPANATAKSKLPVMVHLHPGGNWCCRPFENADAFTARNVVVVTLAYRLNVFGWMGHPILTG